MLGRLGRLAGVPDDCAPHHSFCIATPIPILPDLRLHQLVQWNQKSAHLMLNPQGAQVTCLPVAEGCPLPIVRQTARHCILTHMMGQTQARSNQSTNQQIPIISGDRAACSSQLSGTKHNDPTLNTWHGTTVHCVNLSCCWQLSFHMRGGSPARPTYK